MNMEAAWGSIDESAYNNDLQVKSNKIRSKADSEIGVHKLKIASDSM